MSNLLKTTAAALLAVTALAASAQPMHSLSSSELDARQARQAQRIERGVARGEITWREARTLRNEQHEIARAEAAAKSDGHLSRRELRHLEALVDRADANIQAMRHNAPRQPRA